MRIAVLVDRGRLFRWHLVLIEALKARGQEVVLRYRETSDPLSTNLTVILDFDHARGYATAERLSTRMDQEAFAHLVATDGATADVTLDLSTGAFIERQAGPVIRPTYDGTARDYALFQALLDRRAPLLSIWHSESPTVFVIGRPALDDPLVLSAAFDRVASRLVEGLVHFISDGPDNFHATPPPPRSRTSAATPPIWRSAGRYGWARARRKVRRVVDLFSGDSPRWHTAWRAVSGAEPAHAGTVTLANYHVLEDDGDRTFGDPCLFMHEGVAHCFVSAFSEATCTASIAHLTLSPCGPPSPVATLLATPEGMHRPIVFSNEGRIWMLSDSTDGAVHLYRSQHFPVTWANEGCLLEEAIHAPTFFEHGGRKWICGTARAYQSSWNDGLVLYWADRIRGPWHAHSGNPVLIDGTSARPAGLPWHEDGTLIRPGQNLTRPGGGIVLKRVHELTSTAFEEDIDGSITFAKRRGLIGPRTVTRCDGFEAIDFGARPSAVRTAFKAGLGA